jgi:DUF1680 family protein
LPAVPGLIYAKQVDTLYINLYASNEAQVNLNGRNIHITQATNYPWDDKVQLMIQPEREVDFVLKLRVPGWARGEVLPGDLYRYSNGHAQSSILINGKELHQEPLDGYYVIDRKWSGEQTIELNFPMEVRKVVANENVTEDQHKVSLEYGPIVYAVEEIDNKKGFDRITVPGDMEFHTGYQPSLLQGVNVITAQYSGADFTAIPYYTWSNRGVGKMKVWLDN